MKWIRLNLDADRSIRIIYFNDYTLNDDVLYARFSVGAHTTDRFPYNFFVRDKAKNSLFGSRELSLIVVALRISFNLPEMISLSGYVQMTVAGACVTSVGGHLYPLVGVCCVTPC